MREYQIGTVSTGIVSIEILGILEDVYSKQLKTKIGAKSEIYKS